MNDANNSREMGIPSRKSVVFSVGIDDAKLVVGCLLFSSEHLQALQEALDGKLPKNLKELIESVLKPGSSTHVKVSCDQGKARVEFFGNENQLEEVDNLVRMHDYI